MYATSAARTGAGGRYAVGPGLGKFENFVRDLEALYQLISNHAGDKPPRADELAEACRAIFYDADRGGEGMSMGTRIITREFGKNLFNDEKQFMIELIKIKEILDLYDCDLADSLGQLQLNGEDLDYAKLSPDDRGKLFSMLATAFKSGGMFSASVLKCQIIDVAPNLMFEPMDTIKNVLGGYAVGPAGGMEGVDEKQVYKDVIKRYIEHSGVDGFCMVQGFPKGNSYTTGKTLTMQFLGLNQLYNAIDEGRLAFAVTLGSPQIRWSAGEINFEELLELPDESKTETSTQSDKLGDFLKSELGTSAGSSVIDAALQQERADAKRMNTLFEWALSGKRYKQ